MSTLTIATNFEEGRKGKQRIDYAHLTTEPVTFYATFELVRLAKPEDKKNKSQTWQDTADHWRVTISGEYPGEFVTDYYTGTGLRVATQGTKMAARLNGDAKPATVPQYPRFADVLHSLAMGAQMARDWPLDEAAAMDAYATEFGFDGKPSELLRIVRNTRAEVDGMRGVLRHTGIDLDHWADYWADEDNGAKHNG